MPEAPVAHGDVEISAYINARAKLREDCVGADSFKERLSVCVEAADAMCARMEKLLPYVQAMSEIHDIMLNPPVVMDDATAKQCLQLLLQGVRDQARVALE
jgi:hypothetical protein